MSRSVLLQLARDSIAEVLEMQRTIDKKIIEVRSEKISKTRCELKEVLSEFVPKSKERLMLYPPKNITVSMLHICDVLLIA